MWIAQISPLKLCTTHIFLLHSVGKSKVHLNTFNVRKYLQGTNGRMVFSPSIVLRVQPTLSVIHLNSKKKPPDPVTPTPYNNTGPFLTTQQVFIACVILVVASVHALHGQSSLFALWTSLGPLPQPPFLTSLLVSSRVVAHPPL